jgi:hypothetical protein
LVSEIQQGPGDLWIVGTPPDDTAQRLTLAADGTPDATAHPNSIHMGAAATAITVSVTPKIEHITLDQIDAAVGVFVSELDSKIEAELAQSSVKKLQQALGVGAYSTQTGWAQMTFGGGTVVPTFCLAAIMPKRSDATKFIVAILYRVSATGGVQITMSRTKASFYKVQFTGLCDFARTAGRQIGIIYETIA